MPLRPRLVAGLCLLLCCFAAAPLHAEPALHDDTLPSLSPEALQQLSDDRLRQRIMQQSTAPYHGRCSCPYQVRANGRSCRRHIHILKAYPKPICYPEQVTADMLSAWRRHHGEDAAAKP